MRLEKRRASALVVFWLFIFALEKFLMQCESRGIRGLTEICGIGLLGLYNFEWGLVNRLRLSLYDMLIFISWKN